MRILTTICLLLIISCSNENQSKQTEKEVVLINKPHELNILPEQTNYKPKTTYTSNKLDFTIQIKSIDNEIFNSGALQAYSLYFINKIWHKYNLADYNNIYVKFLNSSVNEEIVFSYTSSQIKNNLESGKLNNTYLKCVEYCMSNLNDSTYYEFDIILNRDLPNVFKGFNPNKYNFMEVLSLYTKDCFNNTHSNGITLFRGLAFYFYSVAQDFKLKYDNGNINKKIEHINYFLKEGNQNVIDLNKHVSFDKKNGILVDDKPW